MTNGKVTLPQGVCVPGEFSKISVSYFIPAKHVTSPPPTTAIITIVGNH